MSSLINCWQSLVKDSWQHAISIKVTSVEYSSRNADLQRWHLAASKTTREPSSAPPTHTPQTHRLIGRYPRPPSHPFAPPETDNRRYRALLPVHNLLPMYMMTKLNTLEINDCLLQHSAQLTLPRSQPHSQSRKTQSRPQTWKSITHWLSCCLRKTKPQLWATCTEVHVEKWFLSFKDMHNLKYWSPSCNQKLS